MTDSRQKRIALLGIGGGISAYKAVTVASQLHQQGFDTHVAMTSAAQEFIRPTSFAAVTGKRVQAEMFVATPSDHPEDIYPHIFPASEAEIFAVLPATADLIAKLAHGLAGDVVTASALALSDDCRRYFCPAMHVSMWGKQVVRDNAARLEAAGWRQLGPAEGHLACGATGPGRMLEPEDILEAILADAGQTAKLARRRVLVLSGPTVEYLDPVRFISNRSSGKMGRAIALACARAGATVEFVTGPVAAAQLPLHQSVRITPVESAAQMLAAAQQQFAKADAAVFAAAVADYAPATCQKTKRAKSKNPLSLALEPTPDIAAALAGAKKPGQVCVGFALETNDGPAKAGAKLRRKGLDAIVLNGIDSLGAENGNFRLLTEGAKKGRRWGRISKDQCAAKLVEWLAGAGLGDQL